MSSGPPTNPVARISNPGYNQHFSNNAHGDDTTLMGKLFYDNPMLIVLKLQDVEYLSPIIREVEKEQAEREELDSIIVKRN